eukprot:6185873-Pleurochrysis_carterae.AAC.1
MVSERGACVRGQSVAGAAAVGADARTVAPQLAVPMTVATAEAGSAAGAAGAAGVGAGAGAAGAAAGTGAGAALSMRVCRPTSSLRWRWPRAKNCLRRGVRVTNLGVQAYALEAAVAHDNDAGTEAPAAEWRARTRHLWVVACFWEQIPWARRLATSVSRNNHLHHLHSQRQDAPPLRSHSLLVLHALTRSGPC